MSNREDKRKRRKAIKEETQEPFHNCLGNINLPGCWKWQTFREREKMKIIC